MFISGPGSVINLGGNPGSVLNQDMMNSGPMSVGPPTNLQIPMTPLMRDAHMGERSVHHDHYNQSVPSNIHAVQPFTPASAADIPQPQLQNIVSTVNLGMNNYFCLISRIVLMSMFAAWVNSSLLLLVFWGYKRVIVYASNLLLFAQLQAYFESVEINFFKIRFNLLWFSKFIMIEKDRLR